MVWQLWLSWINNTTYNPNAAANYWPFHAYTHHFSSYEMKTTFPSITSHQIIQYGLMQVIQIPIADPSIVTRRSSSHPKFCMWLLLRHILHRAFTSVSIIDASLHMPALQYASTFVSYVFKKSFSPSPGLWPYCQSAKKRVAYSQLCTCQDNMWEVGD